MNTNTRNATKRVHNPSTNIGPATNSTNHTTFAQNMPGR